MILNPKQIPFIILWCGQKATVKEETTGSLACFDWLLLWTSIVALTMAVWPSHLPPRFSDSRVTAEGSGGVSLRLMVVGQADTGGLTWPGHVTLTNCQAGRSGTRPPMISTSLPPGAHDVTPMPEQQLLPHLWPCFILCFCTEGQHIAACNFAPH